MKTVRNPRVVMSARRPTEVSGPFVCGWSAVGDCAVVRVAGTIDLVTAPTFQTELHRVITTKLPRLVIDLRRITAMEDAGIEVLTGAHELAKEHGGWLRLAGGRSWLTDLIRTAGRFDHYPALADALPSYRPALAGGATSRP
jgi:anti-anti-sigma factor